MGLWAYHRSMTILDQTLVTADSRSRIVLPGFHGRRFLATQREDGSILLEPAVVLSEAQYEYDTNPELQRMLSEAAAGITVFREKRKRRTT